MMQFTLYEVQRFYLRQLCPESRPGRFPFQTFLPAGALLTLSVQRVRVYTPNSNRFNWPGLFCM